MVEPTFLVGLAVAFVLGLILIVRQSAASPDKDTKKKERPASEKKQKGAKKQKGPSKNSLKKDKRPPEIKEWTGIDTAQKDAQDMLEFLKGKDPVEIAKQLNQGKPKQKKQPQQQAKKAKAEDSASEDSASEATPEDGFSKIVKKPKAEKAKEEKKKPKDDKKKEGVQRDKSFFKTEAEAKAEEIKARKERKPLDKPASEGETPERKRKERPEGERRERPEGERRERPEGERRERRERTEGGEPRPEGERRERPERPQRKPIPTVAPIVKYEQADLSDILDSITQDFEKPKPKINRVSTRFSSIPRNIVVSILSRLEARDLVALSRVNHYFSGVARKESLWKDVLQRDFGLKDAGKYRNFRLAYKAEFKKRRAASKKQKKEEDKPAEAAAPAAVSPAEDQQPDKEAKPKQKKDNKKKKGEQAEDAAAED